MNRRDFLAALAAGPAAASSASAAPSGGAITLRRKVRGAFEVRCAGRIPDALRGAALGAADFSGTLTIGFRRIGPGPLELGYAERQYCGDAAIKWPARQQILVALPFDFGCARVHVDFVLNGLTARRETMDAFHIAYGNVADMAGRSLTIRDVKTGRDLVTLENCVLTMVSLPTAEGRYATDEVVQLVASNLVDHRNDT